MDLVVAFVTGLPTALVSLFLYLRHRDRMKLVKHVYDGSGAREASFFVLALYGKASAKLEADDEQKSLADGPGAARAPRTRKRRPRRPRKPRAGDVSSSGDDG